MSALAFEVLTLDIPNPEWAVPGQQPSSINTSISYAFQSSAITTLSTTDAPNGGDITGLLYVPDLNPGDPCINASAPYIPANVTRQAELPKIDYNLIAVAPWLSAECTENYFSAARLDPIRAFIFFQPTNTTVPPPAASAEAWDLGDNGAWKKQNQFPVYAVSGLDGIRLTTESGKYSGNLTAVPFGAVLSHIYDPRDYIRLYVDIAVAPNNTFPSLWVFLLVVLGILLAIIALTSVTMHLIQRRRRNSLRRRVANGEVDLEALGIKRLTVPLEMLKQMPLYAYGTAPSERDSSCKSAVVREAMTEVASSPSTPTIARPAPVLTTRTSVYQPTPLSQPTCAICLDDFQLPDAHQAGSTVRELPCHHIFHPECVDIFLRDSSSLCPMCKKSVLPKGYCPRVITNAMVRRERMLRRIRERVDEPPVSGDSSVEDGSDDSEQPSRRPQTFQQRLRSRTMSSLSQFRSSARNPSSLPTSQPLADLSSANGPEYYASEPQTGLGDAPSHPSSRREWARRRAIAMLGPHRAPLDPDSDDAHRTPAWRKAVRGVFPGFAR